MKISSLVLSTLMVTSSVFAADPKPIITNEEATAMVEKVLATAEPAKTRHYCTEETMTCRTIIEYVDKTTKKPIDFFRLSFYAAERMVAASEFYVKMAEKDTYHRFIDSTFDGKLNINRTDEIQKVLKKKDKVTIKDLYMPKLGTTLVLTSDLIFNDDLAAVDGVNTDTAKPDFKEPIRIEYLRIK